MSSIASSSNPSPRRDDVAGASNTIPTPRQVTAARPRLTAQAAQEKLQHVCYVLETTFNERQGMLEAVCKLTDNLAKAMEDEKKGDPTKAMQVAFDDFNRRLAGIETNLRNIKSNFQSIKREKSNSVLYGKANAALTEQLKFQRFMQGWKNIGRAVIEIGQAHAVARLARNRAKLSEKLAADHPSRLDLPQKAGEAAAKRTAALTQACRIHRGLVAECGQLLGQLRDRNDRTPASEPVYDWDSAEDYRSCWIVMNAAISAASATAVHLFDQVEEDCRPDIARLSTLLQDGDAQYVMPDADFQTLVHRFDQKIASYSLYESIVELVDSAPALAEYWQGPVYRDLREDGQRFDESGNYEWLKRRFTAKLRYEKIADHALFDNCYEGHLKTYDLIAENWANGLPSSQIGNMLTDGRLDQQLSRVRSTIDEVTRVLEDNPANADVIALMNDIKLRGTISLVSVLYLFSMSHATRCVKLIEAHYNHSTLSEQEVSLLAKQLADFYTHFGDAAAALYIDCPRTSDEGLTGRLAHFRRLVGTCLDYSGKLFPAALTVLGPHLKQHAAQAGSAAPQRRDHELLANFDYCRARLQQTAAAVAAPHGSKAWADLECSLLEIGLFDVDDRFRQLQKLKSVVPGELDTVRDAAIRQAQSEWVRCAALYSHFQALRDSRGQAGGADSPAQRAELAELEAKSNRLGRNGTMLEGRIAYMQVQAVLESQPSVRHYFEMVSAERAQLLVEIDALLELDASSDIDGASDGADHLAPSSTFRLFDELTQVAADTRTVHKRILKKIDQLRLGERYGPVAGYLESIEEDIGHTLQRLSQIAGDAPELTPLPTNRPKSMARAPSQADARHIELEALDKTLAQMAIGSDEVEPEAAPADAPSIVQLSSLAKASEQRVRRASDMLNVAGGWRRLAEELAADEANPAHVKKFFDLAAAQEDAAAALLEQDDAAWNALPGAKGVKRHARAKAAGIDAAQARLQAEETLQRGASVFRRLTKAKPLPRDRDLVYVLDQHEIRAIKTSRRQSYTPINAATGQPRVDAGGNGVTKWLQEMIITLKPEPGAAATPWVVHLHYPTEDARYFTVAHAKRFEDRNKGSASGKVERRYVAHETARKLLGWAPKAA